MMQRCVCVSHKLFYSYVSTFSKYKDVSYSLVKIRCELLLSNDALLYHIQIAYYVRPNLKITWWMDVEHQ